MVELLAQILTLLQNIVVKPLIWLFPIKWVIIYPGESGVRYTAGKPGERLESGFHFATTCQVLQKIHSNTQVVVTEPVFLLTKNGISLQVDVVLVYAIIDFPAYLASSEEPATYLVAVAEASLRTAISAHPFEFIVSDSSTIEKEVRKQIMETTKGCGIRLKHVRFQNIRHEDPYARMACSVPATASFLTKAAKTISTELCVSHEVALMSLSQNIQPTITPDLTLSTDSGQG